MERIPGQIAFYVTTLKEKKEYSRFHLCNNRRERYRKQYGTR